MVESRPRQRGRPTHSRTPRGKVSLAQRAAELGITVASLRRYVNRGSVQGQATRVGNRIYVDKDLMATPRRARRNEPQASLASRSATVTRETGETRVSVEVGLDGRGQYTVRTGDAMLDHLLAQLARHGLMDLRLTAKGDDLPDGHHLAEDIAIVLGRALRQAVGEGRAIRRMGSALVPLDESLAQVSVDFGGRGYAVVETQLTGQRLGNFPGEMIVHFMERLALEGGFNLHARVVAGTDPHHKAEALFKALARALRDALEVDPRRAGDVPSTKGTVSG